MPNISNTFAVAALRRKRAHQAGEIGVAERAIAAQLETLATLDAAILLLDPAADPSAIRSIRPVRRCLHFRRGEQRRLCLDALRVAKGTDDRAPCNRVCHSGQGA